MKAEFQRIARRGNKKAFLSDQRKVIEENNRWERLEISSRKSEIPREHCFPGGSDGKASACSMGDLGSIPGLGTSPGERKWQPTPVFLPGESRGQRSLVGYRPQGHTESNTTEVT